MKLKGAALIYFILIPTIKSQSSSLLGYEKHFKNGILPLIPKVLERTPSNQLTKCGQDMIEWKNSLTSTLWAGKMLDANGKFPSGLLIGNFFGLGEFSECIMISETETKKGFSGKYCPVLLSLTNTILSGINTLRPLISPNNGNLDFYRNNKADIPNIPLVLGACMPSSCNMNEVLEYLGQYLESNGANLTKPIFSGNDRLCSVADEKFTDSEIAGISVLSFFAILMVLSTFYDLMSVFVLKKKCCGHDFWIAFSIYTNMSKLTKVNKSGSALRCLHGMRVLSMTWIVLAHRFGNSSNFPTENILLGSKIQDRISAMAIMGASVSVDTFFLMSGLLLAYVFLNQHEKKKNFNPGLFYLHRFLRLWPAMAAAVFISSTMVKALTKGPLWPFIAYTILDTCKETWWSTLLYIQNYVNPENMCIGHTWYLAIDTQLYILSPIILIPLWKWPKFGRYNLIFWTIVFQVSVATVSYLNNWKAFGEGDWSYWNLYYSATYSRGIVWVLGTALGYILYLTKRKTIRINRLLVFICWLISLTIIGAVIFGVKPFTMANHKVSKLHDGTFNAFARTGWAIAVSWIIFACVHGYGGVVNWFLSWRAFEVAGKLSYSIYLLHLLSQMLFDGSNKIALHYRELVVVYTYFGDLVFTFLLSILMVLAFESPFLALEKAIFHKPPPKLQRLNDDPSMEKTNDLDSKANI